MGATLLRTAFGVCAIATFATCAEAANVLQAKKRVEVVGSAAELWKVYGGFCAIANWHPAIAKCDESKEGDARFRKLTLKGGGETKEKLTGTSETGYTYQIVESPLPVKDYNAAFSIRPDDEPEKAVLSWSAAFMAKDKPEAEAKSTIQGYSTPASMRSSVRSKVPSRRSNTQRLRSSLAHGTCQIMAVPSSEAVARSFPSGLSAIPSISFVCPSSSPTTSPV